MRKEGGREREGEEKGESKGIERREREGGAERKEGL